MFKIAIAFTACLTCLVFAVPSRADTVEQSGYVCSAAFVPTNGSGMAPAANKGRLGYVTFDLYSGPHCSGQYLSSGYFCSSGATSRTDCFPFSQIDNAAALAQKEATLITQAARGHQVTVYRRSPKGAIIFVRSFGD